MRENGDSLKIRGYLHPISFLWFGQYVYFQPENAHELFRAGTVSVVAEFFWFFKMLISKGIKSAYCLTVIIFCGFSLIAVKFMVDVDVDDE